MRQSEVLSQFLDRFDVLFPQFAFRGLRRFPSRSTGPFGLALHVAVGKSEIPLHVLGTVLVEGHREEVARMLRRVRAWQEAHPLGDSVPVLIAPSFSAEAIALCREAGVGYLDLAGNAGIDTLQAYVLITGKAELAPRPIQVRAPFEGKAEQVVRALLLDVSRRWSMRDLAQSAQVSLGLASMVTTVLAEQELLRKTRAGLTVYNPAALLAAWAQSYDLRRSPFRIYRSWADVRELERRIVDQGEACEGKLALTLWSAAYHLLDEENALPRLALYWDGAPEELAQCLHLSEEKGRTHIFVFQPYDASLFWGATKMENGLTVVNPVQVVLDLGSGDEEELHLAQRVRERLLPW
ncbi:MAG: type IV toxin-antitoxin system AbiEi family antitoxin [Anaerolineae bacterium]